MPSLGPEEARLKTNTVLGACTSTRIRTPMLPLLLPLCALPSIILIFFSMSRETTRIEAPSTVSRATSLIEAPSMTQVAAYMAPTNKLSAAFCTTLEAEQAKRETSKQQNIEFISQTTEKLSLVQGVSVNEGFVKIAAQAGDCWSTCDVNGLTCNSSPALVNRFFSLSRGGLTPEVSNVLSQQVLWRSHNVVATGYGGDLPALRMISLNGKRVERYVVSTLGSFVCGGGYEGSRRLCPCYRTNLPEVDVHTQARTRVPTFILLTDLLTTMLAYKL
jgi:hypothetical protein